jgi:hypothetical protein
MADETPEELDERAQRGELYLLAGMTISRFAVLETYLVLLFAECLGVPRNVAAALLQPVRNFTTTLDIVDVAVRHKIETQNALSYWTSLLDYIRELSGDRNYLAHTPVMQFDGVLDDPLHLIGPPLVTIIAGDLPRIMMMPETEVRELSRDVEQAVDMCVALWVAVSKGPLPDKFSRPIERRRPPRGIRQAALRQTPPPLPRSSPP